MIISVLTKKLKRYILVYLKSKLQFNPYFWVIIKINDYFKTKNILI